MRFGGLIFGTYFWMPTPAKLSARPRETQLTTIVLLHSMQIHHPSRNTANRNICSNKLLEFSQQVAATSSWILMKWGADLSHFPSAMIVRRTIAKIHRNTVKYKVLRPSGHPNNPPGARFVCSIPRGWRANRQNSRHFVRKSLCP